MGLTLSADQHSDDLLRTPNREVAMLRRILYVSIICRGLTRQEVEQIAARARMANRRLDLTGVLAVGHGVFAQVLEGSAEGVADALGRIQSDARHSDLRLVLDDTARLRLFDRWSMELLMDEDSALLALGARNSTVAPQALLQRLKDKHAEDPHCR